MTHPKTRLCAAVATTAIPVTAITFRRHHSTGTVATAKTGTMAQEWDVTSWTMVPAEMFAATCASEITTFSTISHTPSAVRAPASNQSMGLSPLTMPLEPSLIARPPQTRTCSTTSVGLAADFSARDCTNLPIP